MQEVLPATLPRPRENETGTAKNEVKSFKTKLINLAFHLQATGSQGRFLVTVTITAAPSAGRAASDAAGRVPRRKAVRVPRAGLVMGPWSGWTVGKESGRRHSRRGTIDRTRQAGKCQLRTSKCPSPSRWGRYQSGCAVWKDGARLHVGDPAATTAVIREGTARTLGGT